MNRHILVTGSAGRVGRRLIPLLRGLGWEVAGCDLNPAEGDSQADCGDLKRMCELLDGKKAVIHLAAQHQFETGWETLRTANIDATMTMLTTAQAVGCRRFVYASSIHTVGLHPADSDFHPALPDAPSGLYGATKIASEALLKVCAAKASMVCTSVRICTFADAPRNARELKTWLSPDDAAHLFDRVLNIEQPGYRMIWGVSANAQLKIDDPVAREIGYSPQSDAERHRDELALNGIDLSNPYPWSTLGGRMTDEDDFAASVRC